MTIQAAIEGHGVALTRGELVERELATGQLVRPFAIRMPAAFASYVVCPEETAHTPKIAAFREWLIEEAEAGRQQSAPAGAATESLRGVMPLHCVAPEAKATRSLRREKAAPRNGSRQGPDFKPHSTLARKTDMRRELALRRGKPSKRRGRG